MRKYLVLIILLQAIACGHSQVVNETPDPGITAEEASQVLAFHNNARSEVGVPPLEWSAELAEYAQEWAEYLAAKNNCQMAHRGALNQNPKNAGENIFWGAGAAITPLSACQVWVAEKSQYDPQGSFQSNFPQTGHYMQMVWRTTTHVGLGMAKCTNGSTIVVASYLPAGNIIGQKPY